MNNIHWPAEWEEHAGTWLAWPHNEETWPGKFEPVPAAFAAMATAFAQFEPIFVLDSTANAFHKLQNVAGRMTIFDIATNDAWIRDFGPTFVRRNGELAGIDWRYNAWGGKYPPWENDAQATEKICSILSCRRIESELLVEGGAIEGNGVGDILTTKSCLLNANRNDVSTATIENELKQKLGAERVHWLTGGDFAGDDTDGHIDQLARFVNENTIVAAAEENPSDENYEVLQQLHAELRELRNAEGEPFTIVPLPMPAAISFRDQRLPASYANFCFVNGGLIVPQFNDPADEQAIAILGELLPDRTLVGVDTSDLILGLGGPHCLSQQQPI